ncbi:MAG: hypothetical protein ACE5KA_07770 [Nitrososphaerales archaeon]
MAREEREKLAEVAKELIALLDIIKKDDNLENSKYTEVRKKTLDLLKHLAHIGGFCDQSSQDRIRGVTELVSISLDEAVHHDSLRKLCVLAVGLQVDFNKSPFMITEFDVNLLANEFRSLFKR